MTSVFLEKSLPELLAAIDAGELSFEDLASTTNRMVAEREPSTLAWVVFDADQLSAQAAEAWKRFRATGVRLRLDGIPFGVKDIFNTRVFPTQMGSPIWKDFSPGNNARVVDSLAGAGALVAGKTVTAEFAVHALNETLNPHDPTRTPGTSSSGSAVAVAAGMVPFALGSQTAGSITRPASFCGVWGMKPSFGLLPRTGVLKTTDSLDTIGFLAAHATSLRPILDASRVKGPDYPFVYRNVDRQGAAPKKKGERYRLGFVRTHTWDGAADYAKAAVEDLAAKIGAENDFVVDEIPWPKEFSAVHALHALIYTKSLSYYFQHESKLSSYISPIMADMIAEGQEIPTSTLQQALREQEVFARRLDDLLAPYDLVLSLGTSSAAPVRGDTELPDPSLIWTLGHVPSIAAPTFRSPDRLPFGVQFVSRRWNDYLLLQGIETLVERGILPCGSMKVERWQ